MNTILVFIGITIIVMVIIFLYLKKNKKNILSAKEATILNKVKTIYLNDIALDRQSIYQQLEISNINQMHEIFANHPKELSLVRSYENAVYNRFALANYKIIPSNPKQYNLILKKNEILYHCIRGIVLYKEKIIGGHIMYSGIKWNSKYSRIGSLSYIKNDISNFVKIDNGSIFLTNQRILFIGKNNKTISIELNNIITYHLYSDGILVLQPNTKPILFEFHQDSPILLQDGRNEFTIVLSRILNENIDSNLIVEDPAGSELDFNAFTDEEKALFAKLDEIKKKMQDLKSGNMKIYNDLKSIE